MGTTRYGSRERKDNSWLAGVAIETNKGMSHGWQRWDGGWAGAA